MAGARVAEVLTTLHETAKHVGGQTIKFNKSILKSLEPKKKKKRKSLESTSDGAPEVENLGPENLQPLLPPEVKVQDGAPEAENLRPENLQPVVELPDGAPEVKVEENDMSSESCSKLETQLPLEVEKNDMSSSKPSSQILMYMMHGYDKIGNVTVSDTSRVHVGYEYKCAR